MSFFDKPLADLKFYNDRDFLTYGETANGTANTTTAAADEFDHSLLLEKTGGVLSGNLTVPSLSFSGYATPQLEPFTNFDKAAIANVVNIEASGLDTLIPKMLVDEIYFRNDTTSTTHIQTIPYLESDKLQIESNKGNIDTLLNNSNTALANITSSGTDVVITNSTLSVKDAPVDTSIVNPLGNESFFDSNLVFMRSNNQYRKFYMGMLGDNINATNSWALGVNGNDPSVNPEILMSVDFNGNLKISGDLMYNGGDTSLVSELFTLTNNISTNSLGISHNSLAIGNNTSQIGNNTTQIAANTPQITANTTQIAANTAQIVSNATTQGNLIQGNSNQLAAHSIELTQNTSDTLLNTNFRLGITAKKIIHLKLNEIDLVNMTIPNGQKVGGDGIYHDLNLGTKILDADYGGWWNRFDGMGGYLLDRDYEVSVQISFTCHSSYVYQMECGLRLVLGLMVWQSHPDTADFVDVGIKTVNTPTCVFSTYSLSFSQVVTFNNYLEYALMLRTNYHFQTASVGNMKMKGYVTVREL